MAQENILQWIQEWYLSQCDGEWEHEYGVKIETADNPGWSIHINLEYTQLEELKYETPVIEKFEHDWYFIKVENSIFYAAGDPTKLEFLLKEFKKLVEQHTPKG
jgi:hypothetical protein